MQLDQIRFVLRPRRSWTALDLGFNMAQRWWLGMLLRGSIVLLPVFALVIYIQDVIWGMLLLWWFKPLYERPPLKFLSNAVFAESSSLRELMRGTFDSPMFVSLTFGRFSWRRSAIAAITLEDGTHTEMVERKKVLYEDGATFLMWPALLGLFFEIALAILVYQVIASFFETSQGLVISSGDFIEAFTNAVLSISAAIDAMSFWEISGFLTIYAFVILVVMPFFVASGFSLYLNQRTLLEGWDIEVGFNKLVQRLGLLLLLLCIWQPLDVHANEAKDHETAIQEVRTNPEFNQIKTIKLPVILARLRDWLASDDDDDIEGRDSILGGVFGVIMEVIFWVAMAALLVYFVYRIATLVEIQALKPAPRAQRTDKPSVYVDELSRLPQDILRAASRAWQANDARSAYSLLYLGAIRYLRDELECKIGKDQTEAECVRRTNHLAADLHRAFKDITSNWQRVAYAGGEVQQTQFDETVERFRRFFVAA